MRPVRACSKTAGRETVMTANALTMSRLLLTVPIVALMHVNGPAAAWTALGLFLLAMLTDVFDGPLARRDPNRSPLGSYLDPVADKVLLMSLFICLAAGGVVPAWMVVVLVAREFVVSGVRSAGAMQGRLVGANWMGKTKTLLQTFAIGFALGGGAMAVSGAESTGAVFLRLAWWTTLVVTVAATVFAAVFVRWNWSILRGVRAD